MRHKSAKYTLHDVSAIQTIHAVGSESSFLRLYYSKVSWIVESFSIIHSNIYLGHKVTIVMQFVSAYIHQPAQVFPFHIFAFAMKVKPHVIEPLVTKFRVQFGKLVAYTFL